MINHNKSITLEFRFNIYIKFQTIRLLLQLLKLFILLHKVNFAP